MDNMQQQLRSKMQSYTSARREPQKMFVVDAARKHYFLDLENAPEDGDQVTAWSPAWFFDFHKDGIELLFERHLSAKKGPNGWIASYSPPSTEGWLVLWTSTVISYEDIIGFSPDGTEFYPDPYILVKDRDTELASAGYFYRYEANPGLQEIQRAEVDPEDDLFRKFPPRR